MTITEAILARTEDKPFITRQSWLDEVKMGGYTASKILPTDSPDVCIIHALAAKNPCRGWQPSAGDLVATDWITVR